MKKSFSPDDKKTADRIPFRRFFLLSGILMAASELWKQCYLTLVVNESRYDPWYFPFQLCSIPMYLLLILPHLRPGRARRTLLTFLMCYSLLSGVIVFADTTGMHYPVFCLTLHSYLWHILLIVIGLAAGICRINEQPREKLLFRDLLPAAALYLLCCCIASVINLCLSPYGETNMFYINPHIPMVQFVFSDLAEQIGNTPTLFLYMASTILGAGLLFLPWKLLFYLIERRRIRRDADSSGLPAGSH